MTEDEKRLLVGARGGGKTKTIEIGIDPAVHDAPQRISAWQWLEGWVDLFGYVFGHRERSQRDREYRWPWLDRFVHCDRWPLIRYEISRWEIIRCRWTGHRCGMVWHNPGSLEPDMHCIDCNEDLG